MEKNLITLENANEAQNPHNSKYDRASSLLRILLNKIEVENKQFQAVVDILQKIPALNNLAEVLESSACGSSCNTGN